MRRLPVFIAALALAGCGAQEPPPEMTSGVRYWFDFGQETRVGSGPYLGVGGWTTTYSCTERSEGTGVEVSALRIDDPPVENWSLERDGGTPPPRTRSGVGLSLEVTERDDDYEIVLVLAETVFRATAPVGSSPVGFHHVAYQDPPKLLAIKSLVVRADDGTTRTVTGTVSFPNTCSTTAD